MVVVEKIQNYLREFSNLMAKAHHRVFIALFHDEARASAAYLRRDANNAVVCGYNSASRTEL